MALKNNTWKINQWYDQNVAGNATYSGEIQLFAAGRNNNGQFGQNNRTNYSSPVQIPGTTWAKDKYDLFANSGEHVVLPKTDGTLWAVGNNSDWGQLGQNNRTDYSSPVQIGSGTDWNTAGTFNETSWGVKTDGTLWTWGRGYYGLLGQNQEGPSTFSVSSPTQVPGTTWERCYGVQYAAFATKTDGTLWAWGSNSPGALGQNNRTQYSSPVQIGSTDWSVVDGGSPGNGGGIKTDGTLYLWGRDPNGQLGQNQAGDNSARSSPTQVGSDTTWRSLSLGNKKTVAIKTDNTLWVWGRNSYGSLGRNEPDTTHYSSPVQVPGTTWSTVSASYSNVYAFKTDGTLWGWGYGLHGALCQNNRTEYSSPVQIPGTDWVYIEPFASGNAFYATKEV